MNLRAMKDPDYAEYLSDQHDDAMLEEARSQANDKCAECKHLYADVDIDVIFPACAKTTEPCPEHEKDCYVVRRGRTSLSEIEYDVYTTIILYMHEEWRMPTQREVGEEFRHGVKWAHRMLKNIEKKGYIRINNLSRGIELVDYKIQLIRYDGVAV